MTGLFRTLTPTWNIPGVQVCTFLARDTDQQPVSFSLSTDLGRLCRERLERLVQPAEPIVWLQQVHEDSLVEFPMDREDKTDEIRPLADACYTFQSGIVCAVLSADCLPVVLVNEAGTAVAAIHAGRRGIELDILTKTVNTLGEPEKLMAWIGPGISVSSYPVSLEIREEFLQRFPEMTAAFKTSAMGDCCMDLSEIARLQLLSAGLLEQHISIAVKNTFTDPDLHSARRDGDASGRMATLVWME